MSISSTTRKAGPYAGNNVTAAFPFKFKVFSDADLIVIDTDPNGVETTLALSTDYTVALNADQNASPGGTVTLAAGALATGYLLTITSAVSALQPADLTNQGGFYPSVINDALDRLTILAQQVAEQVGRAVKVNISSSTDPAALVNQIIADAASAAASAADAANSATAAANAVPSGSLTYTPVDKAGDTMTGNLAVPGINVGGSGVVTSLGNAATKTTGQAIGNVPLVEDIPTLAIPAGAVMHFAMSTAPSGWLKANGALISRTTYAALFAAIGTTFGAGDGSTTFGLPDLRGEFMRGFDDGRGVDSGRVFGSAQAGSIQSHSHSGAPQTGTAGWQSGSGGATWNQFAQTGASGGTETRPRNVAALACIKY